MSDIVKAEKQELKDKAKLEREINRNTKMEEKRMEQEYKENEKRYKVEVKRIIQEEAEKERLDKIRRKTVYDYRYYIKVDFDDKDEAKGYGARWNPERKQWYIPPKCKNTYILKEKYDK